MGMLADRVTAKGNLEKRKLRGIIARASNDPDPSEYLVVDNDGNDIRGTQKEYWEKFEALCAKSNRISMLACWLDELFWGNRGSVKSHTLITAIDVDGSEDGLYKNRPSVHFQIATERYLYHIHAYDDKDGYDSYLGCYLTGRTPEIGVEHTGGGDLADGEFNENTWNRFLRDVIKTESLSWHDGKTVVSRDDWYEMNDIKMPVIKNEAKKKIEELKHGLTRDGKRYGVSIGKDKDGYFCYTHRARSKSYPTIADIPKSALKFIDSTGMKTAAKKEITDEQRKTILSHPRIDHIGTAKNRAWKIWRGESDSTGGNAAKYGHGLYTTTHKKEAEGYGAVKQMSFDDLPGKTLWFKTPGDWEIWWNDALYRILGYKNLREFGKDYPRVDEFIRTLDPSIEGVAIGDITGAMFVKYPDAIKADAKKDTVASALEFLMSMPLYKRDRNEGATVAEEIASSKHGIGPESHRIYDALCLLFVDKNAGLMFGDMPISDALDKLKEMGYDGVTRRKTEGHEPVAAKRYTLLGITDERTDCDVCGKNNLKSTMVLQDNEDGDIKYCGSECGRQLLGDGIKEYVKRGHDLNREVREFVAESWVNHPMISRLRAIDKAAVAKVNAPENSAMPFKERLDAQKAERYADPFWAENNFKDHPEKKLEALADVRKAVMDRYHYEFDIDDKNFGFWNIDHAYGTSSMPVRYSTGEQAVTAAKKKELTIWDFDGTLIDTGEFHQSHIDDPKPIKKNLDKFKKQIADDEDVVVMTARSNAGLVRRTLEDAGVDMVGIRIIALGTTKNEAKGEYIAKNFASKYDTITLYDDRKAYLDAAEEAMEDKDANFKTVKAAASSDEEYLAAVDRNDMATAQSMVDAAAKAAGYTVGPVYHGTNSKFNVFKPQFGKAIWFSEDREKIARGDSGASGTQRIVPVFLKATNPAGWKEYDKLLEMQIISNGFDSVHLDDDWIVYSPSQIKSAEPVVYNNFGKVVPLSKRFNSSSNDIRARRIMAATTKKYQITYSDGHIEFKNMSPSFVDKVKARDNVAAVEPMPESPEKVEAANENKGEYDLWGSIEKAVERGLLTYVGFMAADYLLKKKASYGLENYSSVIDSYAEVKHGDRLTDDDKSLVLKRLNDAGWDASDEGMEFLWDEILRHRQAAA